MDNQEHQQTRFSVIIPVYNRGKMVTEAIESVLSQGFSDYELIVVDDGSTDETPKMLERYRDAAQIITQKNSGPEAARNRGADAAKGEYLVFLDSDDLLMPWALGVYDTIVSAMAHPALIVARMIYFEGEKPALLANPIADVEAVTYGDFLSKDRLVPKSNSSMVLRKSVFQGVGGFRCKPLCYPYPCDDCDLLLRAGVRGPAVLVIKPHTVAYRIHEGNMINDTKRIALSILSLIRAEKEGSYPGGNSRLFDRYAFIGGMVLAWSKSAFSSGFRGLGLRLFTLGLPMVVAGAFRKFLIGLRGRRPTIKIKLEKEHKAGRC